MKCQRCRKEIFALIMSKFNTDEICPDCHEKERQHPKYQEADQAEIEAIKKGDFNFSGIGGPADLLQ